VTNSSIRRVDRCAPDRVDEPERATHRSLDAARRQAAVRGPSSRNDRCEGARGDPRILAGSGRALHRRPGHAGTRSGSRWTSGTEHRPGSP
jgi:hypothetical protein